MLTPKEIVERSFPKSMGGYRTEEVDRFLETIASEYEEMQAENRELQEKIMVLAEKLEEYRNDEESLRAALLGAQKLGDSVVRDSKAKAEAIIREANAKGEAIVEGARRQLEREQLSLQLLQKEVSSFKSKIMAIYKQHLEIISTLPSEEKIPVKPAETEDEKPTAQAPAEETTPAEDAAPQAAAAEETAAEETRAEAPAGERKREPVSSKFGPLMFGEGFELNRDNSRKR